VGLRPVLDCGVPFFFFETELDHRTSHGQQHLDNKVRPPNPCFLVSGRGWVLRQHYANSKAHQGSSGERGPNYNRHIWDSAAQNEANNSKPKNYAQINPVIKVLFQQTFDPLHNVGPEHRHHPANGNSNRESIAEQESEKSQNSENDIDHKLNLFQSLCILDVRPDHIDLEIIAEEESY
jgi:hypothetical protein